MEQLSVFLSEILILEAVIDSLPRTHIRDPEQVRKKLRD